MLLVVPLAVISHNVDVRLTAVGQAQQKAAEQQEQTASEVAQLAEEVAQTRADLRLTREELSDTVRQRIEEKLGTDSSLFESVKRAPSRDDVLRALNRARKLELIPEQGCRVSFASGVYLRFRPDFEYYDRIANEGRDPDTIELTLEYIDAEEVSRIVWDEGESAADISVRVQEAMVASGTYPGPSLFDAGKIFEDLGTLLSLAHHSSTSGAVEPLRHVIQFCPPQWVVADDGVYSTDTPYQVAADRIRESDWNRHMSEKPWVDIDSFVEATSACRALYDAGELAVKPPEYSESSPDPSGPPF